ncbi:hypothetical protein PFISCL1PPCAC_18210, partial [Pristionchus fissidentatus]
APIYFTRHKLALRRKSFMKLRLINLHFDFIQMFMGSSFKAIHIGLPLIKYSVDRRIWTKLLLDLRCQVMTIEGLPEILLN